jgi:hypothetical protein
MGSMADILSRYELWFGFAISAILIVAFLRAILWKRRQ